MDSKFFRIPFGTSGTLNAVPDAAPVDGSVSYDSGWGVDYALDPGTDPSALLIDRGQQNQINFDITKSLSRLQTFDAPQWITSANNGGSPYSYAQYARVLYTDGNVWVSIVAANTAEPSMDPTKWIIFLSDYATAAALAAETAARIAADALKAPLASPTFTGVPAAPTAALGTNTTQIATTAFVLANRNFTSVVVGAQTSFSAGAFTTFTWTLGAPKILEPWLICTSAEAGYAVNDTVKCPPYGSYSGEKCGVNWHYNPGALALDAWVGAQGIRLPNAGTGADTTITPSKWKLYYNAYL